MELGRPAVDVHPLWERLRETKVAHDDRITNGGRDQAATKIHCGQEHVICTARCVPERVAATDVRNDPLLKVLRLPEIAEAFCVSHTQGSKQRSLDSSRI